MNRTTLAASPAKNSSFVPGVLQRKCACGQHADGGECAECHKPRVLQRRSASAEPVGVPDVVHEALRSPGQPLDEATRAFMEPRFGHDFSGVRVHTDAKAGESASAVNALAYTVGRDVVFGVGHYMPAAIEGRRLLAHELTHIVQQRGLPAPIKQNLSLGQPDDSYEQEAEYMADAVIGAGARPVLRLQKAPVVQRKVPTGITLKESKPFGHEKLAAEEDKKKFRTYIGAVTLMGVTPEGDYSEERKKGDCVREFLTEVSNTCPATHDFCAKEKCLEIGRYGTSGDPRTNTTVTDGPDTFIDRHITSMDNSFLEGSGKNVCSVVCHQRYKYRTEPDKKYYDLGSFYIIRNFRAVPPKNKGEAHVTTGEVKKVAATLEAPSKEKFAKDVAPGLKKGGSLADAPSVPAEADKKK